MPKRNEFSIDDTPIHFRNKLLCMQKSYTWQEYRKQTVLTNDLFTFVSFYYTTHKKAMKYQDTTLKTKYGNATQFHYEFYWKQAKVFYDSAKSLPDESAPLAAYYCMLNAAKSYIAFKKEHVDDFVGDFGLHGLNEDNNADGENLATINIKHKQKGVFPLFAELLDSDFTQKWPAGTPFSLKSLLYNLPFVHRTFSMTYNAKNKKVEELFLPLNVSDSPKYYKANDGKAYLVIDLEKNYFATNAQTIPSAIAATLPSELRILDDTGFKLISTDGSTKYQDSISSEIKLYTQKCRKFMSYIKGSHRLWYLKRSLLPSADVLNLCNMTLIMASMHRVSEIVRYKPEQLLRLMQSKENWLLHEFITLALDQFIDEIACEITGQDIMCTSQK
ncbi:MAG: YaaC family protein [Christensenellaceae bacterium]|jgi:hypothetical protein